MKKTIEEMERGLDINALMHLAALSNSQDGNTITNTANTDNRNTNTSIACVVFMGLSLLVMMFEFWRQDSTATIRHNDMEMEIHDLRAWKDVHSRDISDIRSQLKETK